MQVGGNDMPIEFVQKPRIRNTYLRFRDCTLVVVARNRKSMQKALDRHRNWIAKHYKQVRESVRLFDSNAIFYNSARHAVKYEPSGSRPRSEISEGVITVHARSPEAANRHILRRMIAETQSMAGEMAYRKAEAIGKKPRSVRARRYRKWGACKSDGSITINFCISMLPSDLQDYTVSHEVAHLAEMNHSRSFWDVVGMLCPDYKALRKRLAAYDNKWREVIPAVNPAKSSDSGNSGTETQNTQELLPFQHL